MSAARNETERRGNAALGTPRIVTLAAAPIFAAMAVLTGMSGGHADILCSAMHGASPLSGMVPMYVLMSLFHSGPWLKLISRRRGVLRLSSQSEGVRTR